MYSVPPNGGERFYLRLLLTVVKGMLFLLTISSNKPLIYFLATTSYQALRTVNGVLCNTFKDACQARGLLDDDQEWLFCLQEAAGMCTGQGLHNLFVTILLFLLRSLYFTPILFAIPRDRTPNLTMITAITNHYTPYPMQRHWSRLSHSFMAVCLMLTSCQTLHHAYRTASHLGASCISSPLYHPYLASCSSHVFLMTCTRPIGYDPLI